MLDCTQTVSDFLVLGRGEWNWAVLGLYFAVYIKLGMYTLKHPFLGR